MFRVFLSLSIGSLLCFQLVACNVSPTSAQSSEQMTVEALAADIEQGSAPLILDVRSPEEFATGHIPGAVNIYYRDIPNQIEAIRALGGDEVVVYCERGVRAGIADNWLSEAGFSSVIQLTGHMPAWREANFSIVTEAATEAATEAVTEEVTEE